MLGGDIELGHHGDDITSPRETGPLPGLRGDVLDLSEGKMVDVRKLNRRRVHKGAELDTSW